MPRVAFEPTMPVFEWAKTFRALDRADTVIGSDKFTFKNLNVTFRSDTNTPGFNGGN
jgi:hypothetical protein